MRRRPNSLPVRLLMELSCPIVDAKRRNASGKRLSSKLPAVSRPDCGSGTVLGRHTSAFFAGATRASAAATSRDLGPAGALATVVVDSDFDSALFVVSDDFFSSVVKPPPGPLGPAVGADALSFDSKRSSAPATGSPGKPILPPSLSEESGAALVHVVCFAT